MAFQRRRRVFRGRRRSLKRWTATLENFAAATQTDTDYLFATGPHVVIKLVDDIDYAQNPNVEAKGATCLRIVGSCIWGPFVSENFNQSGNIVHQAVGIILPHEPGNVPNPGDVGELIKEDLMHSWMDLKTFELIDEGTPIAYPHNSFQLFGVDNFVRHDFDVRVKRRLDNQDISLIMSFGTSGAQGSGGAFRIEASVMCRTLLGGNF